MRSACSGFGRIPEALHLILSARSGVVSCHPSPNVGQLQVNPLRAAVTKGVVPLAQALLGAASQRPYTLYCMILWLLPGFSFVL